MATSNSVNTGSKIPPGEEYLEVRIPFPFPTLKHHQEPANNPRQPFIKKFVDRGISNDLFPYLIDALYKGVWLAKIMFDLVIHMQNLRVEHCEQLASIV